MAGEVYDDQKTEGQQGSSSPGVSDNQTAPGRVSFNRAGLRGPEEQGAGKAGGIRNPSDNQAGNNPEAGGSSSATRPGDIKKSEEAGGGDDRVGKGYNLGNSSSTGGKKTKFRFTRKQKIAGGVGATGAISALFFFFSIASGPFEFIHIAQLLEQFHFASLQSESNDRVLKLMRYAYYVPQGEDYKTNLNFIGNRLANNFEAKLNAEGLESDYGHLGINKAGYLVNTDNENWQIDGKPMTSLEEVQQAAQARYGANTSVVETDDGRFLIEQPGYLKAYQLVYTILNKAGYSDVISAVGARLMAVRDEVTLNPLKILDNKLEATIEEKDATWKAQRAAQDTTGTNNITPTGADDAPGNDKVAGQNAESTLAAAQGTASQGQQVGELADTGSPTSGSALSNFTSSVQGKLTFGGTAALGVLCLARGIAQDAGSIKEAQVVLPLVRTGMRAISEGNQVMAGQDVDSNQLGLDSQQLYNSTNKTSWYDADSVQAELGQPQANNTNTKPSRTLATIGSGSPLNFLLTGAPDAILSPVCSTVGQAAQAVLGFLGGPISFAGSTALGLVAGPAVISTISHYLAGEAIDPNATGAQFGNDINYGARLAANDQAVSEGGRALTNNEVATLDGSNAANAKSQFDQQSLAYRLFSPVNRFSLLSNIMDRQTGNIGTNLYDVVSDMLNVSHTLATTFSDILSGAAHAATPTPYNYGFPEIGFSAQEMDDPDVENPYANGDAVATLLDNNDKNGEPDYISLVQQCFGDTLMQTTVTNSAGASNQVWDVQFGTTPVNTFARGYPSASCNNTSDSNWTRIRFFIFDTQTIKSADCYDGTTSTSDQSCDDIGFSDSGDTNTGPTQPANASTVTVNNQVAQQVAQQASTGGTQVGYALYDSSGDNLANYNDTFENYGASITKAMLLVAYLQQVGSGSLSSQAQSELTNMIENSDDASANWIYSQLNNPVQAVNAVAASAGMTGFQLDSSDDSAYVLGQSKITANDFAQFFAKIDTMFPAAQKTFALNLLSHLSATEQVGLLQVGLPGTVYSKEGWKPEDTGLGGAPYVVNQAAQFSSGGTTYGVAVTVSGTTDQATGEAIIKNVVAALIGSDQQ